MLRNANVPSSNLFVQHSVVNNVFYMLAESKFMVMITLVSLNSRTTVAKYHLRLNDAALSKLLA
jgi:hypothetical protein